MSLDQFQTTPNASENTGSGERPEFQVAKYVNLKLFGAIELTGRIFVDPSKQRGMSATQKEHHKTLANAPVEKIEALVQQWLAEGKSPIVIESVRDAAGSEDSSEVELIRDLFK